MARKLHFDKIRQIIADLAERHGGRKHRATTDFIEALVFQILELGVTERVAREAMKRIKEEFADWNDMRVASVREIQDILGSRFEACRERAEDLRHLLADLYTAYRKMELTQVVNTPEGLSTLRALPETTLIRADMIERALINVYNLRTCPLDADQFDLLIYLGGLPKGIEHAEAKALFLEHLEPVEMQDLSQGLREHLYMLRRHDVSGFKPIAFEPPPRVEPKPVPKRKPEAWRPSNNSQSSIYFSTQPKPVEVPVAPSLVIKHDPNAPYVGKTTTIVQKPAVVTEDAPVAAEKPISAPSPALVAKPQSKPTEKPVSKPAEKPAVKADAKVEAKHEAKIEAKVEAKVAPSPALTKKTPAPAKPAAKPVPAKPAAKPAEKPDAKKPATKTTAKATPSKTPAKASPAKKAPEAKAVPVKKPAAKPTAKKH
jgi:hypothetical protein